MILDFTDDALVELGRKCRAWDRSLHAPAAFVLAAAGAS
jgi:hypothetical protein